MLAEFPARERHNRLRVYGYGVPQLGIALWSARNNATLIIEDAIQPFGKFQQESGGAALKERTCGFIDSRGPKRCSNNSAV